MRLNPARDDLDRTRLEYQRLLIRTGIRRFTPIRVSRQGVVVDGHHALRAAAEEGQTVDVFVSELDIPGKGCSILDLDVR